jgi:DNA-binding IclR family transcriptional regulator
VDQVDSAHPVAVRDWTGTRLPMHPVSSGRVFLAAMTPDALDRALAGPVERFTPRTVTDPARLRTLLRDVVRTGVAWTADEYAEGITSVAAPVADASGSVVAAMHIHGPSYRFPGSRRRDALAASLLGAAARLAAEVRRA